jgi:hypothetical protein
MNRRYCILAAAVTIVIGLGALAPARAASWFEKTFYMGGADYSGQLPACENALDAISAQFAYKESHYWNSDLQITGFERVREIAYHPWAQGTIPRRYCRAVALVSDGRRHSVNFWIGEDTGFAGAWAGVRWCVVGLDRNWAYNPACKMALP